MTDLRDDMLAEVRAHVAELRAGVALGILPSLEAQGRFIRSLLDWDEKVEAMRERGLFIPCTRVNPIVALVSREFKVDAERILSPSRGTMRDSEARALVMYLMRERGYACTEIGRALSRDHSTVIHGWSQVEGRLSEDPAFAAQVEGLVKQVMVMPLEPVAAADWTPEGMMDMRVLQAQNRDLRARVKNLEVTNKVLRGVGA